MRTEAHAEADEIFTRDRLATQQTQIFRRLESLEHPARIIAFPRFARPVSVQPGGTAPLDCRGSRGRPDYRRRPRPAVRDLAAQRARRFHGADPGRDAADRTGDPHHPARFAASNDDETFLYEPEVTSSQARVPDSLQYLNAITPGARDYDPR